MTKLVYRISVFALAAAGAFSQRAFAQSTLPPVIVHTTGMIGLAEGQTARFNVLNPGVLPPALGMTCTVALTFFDGAGKVLKTSTVTATPGEAQYLDLFGDADLALMIDQHKQIRATFTLPAIVPAQASGPSSACSLI